MNPSITQRQRAARGPTIPEKRRVRPAPGVHYDNPGTAADALTTSDDFQMYNGATNLYEWKLVGRQELYIPYNSYRISGSEPTIADLLRAGHVNPDYARYELHRVWVVEATLKPGATHVYAKRVFYIDEDSWMIAVTDKYDTHGELWRVAEQHSINCYDVPMLYGTVEVHSDLSRGAIWQWACAAASPGSSRASAVMREITRRQRCARWARVEPLCVGGLEGGYFALP